VRVSKWRPIGLIQGWLLVFSYRTVLALPTAAPSAGFLWQTLAALAFGKLAGISKARAPAVLDNEPGAS
jgi:hypothetical protein